MTDGLDWAGILNRQQLTEKGWMDGRMVGWMESLKSIGNFHLDHSISTHTMFVAVKISRFLDFFFLHKPYSGIPLLQHQQWFVWTVTTPLLWLRNSVRKQNNCPKNYSPNYTVYSVYMAFENMTQCIAYSFYYLKMCIFVYKQVCHPEGRLSRYLFNHKVL